MKTLNLKPGHKAVKTYYQELRQLSLLETHKEGAVSPAFANLLRHCAKQFNWTLYEHYPLKHGNKNIYPDGALVDAFHLPYGYWEAKDIRDDLEKAIRNKFEQGYPKDNILFQTPRRAILYQYGQPRLDHDILQPEALVDMLKTFFGYQPPHSEAWQQAVAAFQDEVPKLGQGLLLLIQQERQRNPQFAQAFEQFITLCREAINPNIAPQAVEEMLIQHLLTERIFRRVFDHPDFANMNIVAREIEKVIQALVFPHGGWQTFFAPLNRFYQTIESTAAVIEEFSHKQAFLNTVCERFFQGFSVKVADTRGIVYTPQPVVKFIVASVEEILRTEFDRSLSDEGVHILDPFVGTGNFLIHVIQTLRKTALPHKYAHELHCNEIMLLPYYIASLNIEHEYMTLTGEYQPFEGICFVDTFELAEEKQPGLFTPEHIDRVERQKQAPIFVIMGNPPYNVGQVNENDNNKNRKYPTIDRRIAETYAKDSAATNKNVLSDIYVKAFRWASDRLGDKGVVAFITNSGFVDGVAFDGMRKHLAQDFDTIYILDLGGNVRQNPQLSGTTHNVFGIQVGVSIALLVKKRPDRSPATGGARTCQVWYARLDEFWRKEQKYEWLNENAHFANVDWQKITPDNKHIWLTNGLNADFETFLPMGTKAAKAATTLEVQTIFKNYSRGAETTRDAWAYNFDQDALKCHITRFIDTYNHEVDRWHHRVDKQAELDDFVLNDDTNIKWSSRLKEYVLRGQHTEFSPANMRRALYRPFSFQWLYFNTVLTHRQGQFPYIFPTPETEAENRVICVPSPGSKQVVFFMTGYIPDLNFFAGSTPIQCFPFYTYEKDGRNRRENITDWALAQFRTRYGSGRGTVRRAPTDGEITKWDIFYYIYAILHHPQYREKYAANLKRELPRIPFAGVPESRSGVQTQGFCTPVESFQALADAGRQLADLHVNYEQQPKYPLQFIETGDQLDWRVEKMKLVKPSPRRRGSEGTYRIMYNRFLTLAGIPPETFGYTLGNKSALHWIIDQYQVKTDTRSGIVNDPNRADEPDYIVNLIQRVITVSVETVRIVKALPALEEEEETTAIVKL